MGTTIQSCPEQPESTEKKDKVDCVELLKKIDELINRKRKFRRDGTKGLRDRYDEQINGESGPGTVGWENHENEFKTQQERLREKLRLYNDKCGPPPPNAWKWATIPPPVEKQWKGPQNISTREAAYNASIGTAGAIAGGYIVYRVIRFLPSLFPPLWPTIPANVAIP